MILETLLGTLNILSVITHQISFIWQFDGPVQVVEIPLCSNVSRHSVLVRHQYEHIVGLHQTGLIIERHFGWSTFGVEKLNSLISWLIYCALSLDTGKDETGERKRKINTLRFEKSPRSLFIGSMRMLLV